MLLLLWDYPAADGSDRLPLAFRFPSGSEDNQFPWRHATAGLIWVQINLQQPPGTRSRSGTTVTGTQTDSPKLVVLSSSGETSVVIELNNHRPAVIKSNVKPQTTTRGRRDELPP